MTNQSSAGVDEMRAAWNDLIAAMQSARDAIDQPQLMPPPQNDRNIAEGYRYLMGFMHYGIERAFHEDPDRPHFRNALSIINRSTIDNADAIYFYAPIDGRQSYRVRGRVADHRHWRGLPALESGPKAPFYVIFEAIQGEMSGDSGTLGELTPGVKMQTGRLDSSAIEVDDDGWFEILLAPEKPAGYSGNFVSTLKVAKQPHPFDADMPAERYAQTISGRQLFADWEHEEAIHLQIEQIGNQGTSPAPYDIATAAAQLRNCGDLVRNQMHYWNAFWTILMGTYGEREGSIPGVAFPRNDFNTVNAASGSTGGGQSTNLYAGGVFELDEDEALIIESRVSVPPQYIGFQLGNLWGESIEYGNSIGSLNGHQMQVDDDGVSRLVLAHSDPGVPNWLDSTGHLEGFLTARWAYSEKPAQQDWPTISAHKVKFSAIRDFLPPGTPKVSEEERRQQISVRQRHVKKRYRVF